VEKKVEKKMNKKDFPFTFIEPVVWNPTPTIQIIREFLRESHITNMTELGVLLFGMNQDNPPEKTIHAIAHFDFDGSCDDCPFGNFGYKYMCRLGKLDVEGVSVGKRHELCPLCFERK